MNPALAVGFQSRSQIARIVSEDWAARNLYCMSCEATTVIRSVANTRAVDFGCEGCGAAYQLKSGMKWNEQRIPDAGYEAMVAAIRSDNVPNLLVMQYAPDWRVRNLLLVGKIRLITDGIAADPVLVRKQYQRIRPISQLKGNLRGWTLDVLRFVHQIGKARFRLDEVYAFEQNLAKLHPQNRHIRPKIRQQLQILRDIGLVSFLGMGNYVLRENT